MPKQQCNYLTASVQHIVACVENNTFSHSSMTVNCCLRENAVWCFIHCCSLSFLSSVFSNLNYFVLLAWNDVTNV